MTIIGKALLVVSSLAITGGIGIGGALLSSPSIPEKEIIVEVPEVESQDRLEKVSSQEKKCMIFEINDTDRHPPYSTKLNPLGEAKFFLSGLRLNGKATSKFIEDVEKACETRLSRSDETKVYVAIKGDSWNYSSLYQNNWILGPSK